jgi:HSP20 family protein
MYMITARAQSSVGFILISAASLLVIYWVRELRIMSRPEEQRIRLRQRDQKDWIYDLIKNNNEELIFVAEVPGPEEQINVKLSSGILRIKGGQNFLKDIPLEMTSEMGISEYKYRNGVLTIKIHRV